MFDYILYNIVFIVLSIAIICFTIGAILRKQISEKILSANNLANHILVFILFFAFYNDQESFIDIAIIYATINFIATIALMKFHSGSENSDFEN